MQLIKGENTYDWISLIHTEMCGVWIQSGVFVKL
jgi:hypothetical protein